MGKILDTIVGSIEEKKEWRAVEARAKALPEDYRTAYSEIKKYIWSSTGVSNIEPFKVLLDLFEESAANGMPVKEVIGDDVAAFVDELVRGEKTYFQDWRTKLNRNIAKKIKEK